MVHTELTFICAGSAVLDCEGKTSLREQVRWLIQGLTLAYGEQVTARFLDLEQDQEDPLVKQVKKEERRFPLVLVDGELKWEEGISLTALKALLEGMGIEPLHPLDPGRA